MGSLKHAGVFALQSLLGIALFLLVGGGAYILHLWTEFLASHGVAPASIVALQALEFFIFAIDVLCLAIFMVKECVTFIRTLIGL